MLMRLLHASTYPPEWSNGVADVHLGHAARRLCWPRAVPAAVPAMRRITHGERPAGKAQLPQRHVRCRAVLGAGEGHERVVAVGLLPAQQRAYCC